MRPVRTNKGTRRQQNEEEDNHRHFLADHPSVLTFRMTNEQRRTRSNGS